MVVEYGSAVLGPDKQTRFQPATSYLGPRWARSAEELRISLPAITAATVSTITHWVSASAPPRPLQSASSRRQWEWRLSFRCRTMHCSPGRVRAAAARLGC